MKNNSTNMTKAEVMLCLLKMSEDDFKKGKAKPIREAFKDLDKRINEFHKEHSSKELSSTSKNKIKKSH